MGSRRKFTREFKLDAVQRLRAGEPAGLVARSLEVSRQELYRWRHDVDKFGERAFPGVGQKRVEETRIAELERKIGQQVLEINALLHDRLIEAILRNVGHPLLTRPYTPRAAN